MFTPEAAGRNLITYAGPGHPLVPPCDPCTEPHPRGRPFGLRAGPRGQPDLHHVHPCCPPCRYVWLGADWCWPAHLRGRCRLLGPHQQEGSESDLNPLLDPPRPDVLLPHVGHCVHGPASSHHQYVALTLSVPPPGISMSTHHSLLCRAKTCRSALRGLSSPGWKSEQPNCFLWRAFRVEVSFMPSNGQSRFCQNF